MKSGKSGPPELSDFRVREQFWTRFGIRIEDFGKYPQRMIDDYFQIMQAEGAAAAEGNSSSQHNVDATEAAYQAMRKQAGLTNEGG